MPRDETVSLSKVEMAAVRRIAEAQGITEQEAATQLVQSALARRVRQRTGKGRARVYGIKRT